MLVIICGPKLHFASLRGTWAGKQTMGRGQRGMSRRWAAGFGYRWAIALLGAAFLTLGPNPLWGKANAQDFAALITRYVSGLRDNPERFLTEIRESKDSDKRVLSLHKQLEALDPDIPTRLVFVTDQYLVDEKDKYYGVVDEDGDTSLYVVRDKALHGNILILSAVAPERLTILKVGVPLTVTRVFDSWGPTTVMARAVRGVCMSADHQLFLFQNQNMGLTTSQPDRPVLRLDLRTGKLTESDSDLGRAGCAPRNEKSQLK
jgi:hypothetical protein